MEMTKPFGKYIELEADTGCIDDLIGFISGEMKTRGADEGAVFAMTVSAMELFENIIRHGYKKKPGKIRIDLNLEEGEARVSVTDEADGFNMLQFEGPDPKELVKQGISGTMGIKTIRSMCDSVFYDRVENRNINTLVKKIK